MINRAKMPRQLRNKGGIMSVTPGTIGGGDYTGIPMGSRTGFGIVSDIKDRVRKIIPNELADVAVKAAPLVAPFSPKTAALMRGIGRFDQRGSISDAIKQGAATFAFGSATRKLGGTENVFGDFGFSSPLSPERTQSVGSLFQSQQTAETAKTADDARKGLKGVQELSDATIGKVPILRDLPPSIQDRIVFGGITSAASYVYEKFIKEEPPQEEGETVEQYLARRKENVGRKMRTYFDNYFSFDKEYSQLDDAGRDAFVARYNLSDGGRVGYQTGGITMANTLAENIRRNLANQAAFNQMIRPAQIRAAKITPSKITDAKITPSKITDAKITPIETRDLNLNRNPALDLLNQPQQPLFLKDINQTGMPRQITQEDMDTFNFAPPLVGIVGMQSLAELNAIRNRVLAAQAAMKPTYQEALMGESWETLSDNDQYRLAMEYPGETPPRRNPDFVPNVDAGLSGQEFAEKYNIPYAKGGRVKFDEGAIQEEINQIKNSKSKGGMPTGIMKLNKAGVMERDYRETGGFVPVGIK